MFFLLIVQTIINDLIKCTENKLNKGLLAIPAMIVFMSLPKRLPSSKELGINVSFFDNTVKPADKFSDS
jgi:hypothetical protein